MNIEDVHKIMKSKFTYDPGTRIWTPKMWDTEKNYGSISPSHWAWFDPTMEEFTRQALSIGSVFAESLARHTDKINSDPEFAQLDALVSSMREANNQLIEGNEILRSQYKDVTKYAKSLRESLTAQQNVNQWLIEQLTMWPRKYREDMNDMAKMCMNGGTDED